MHFLKPILISVFKFEFDIGMDSSYRIRTNVSVRNGIIYGICVHSTRKR